MRFVSSASALALAPFFACCASSMLDVGSLRDVSSPGVLDRVAAAPRAVPRATPDFEPYENNGGTVVAVAGRDYCIVAADTRLAEDLMVRTRRVSRLYQLSPRAYVASAGCWADTQGLMAVLRSTASAYEWRQGRPIGVRALSQMLSTRLYSRRGFPFYTFNVVAGVDADSGAGCVFSYDAVGSFERHRAVCTGAGAILLQSVVDQLAAASDAGGNGEGKGEGNVEDGNVVAVGCEEALWLLERAFLAGAEREVTLGDEVEFAIITREGVRRHKLQLTPT